MVKYLIYYYLLVNAVLFLLMAYDKRKAITKGWRIPEKTLLTLALLGGGAGGLAGMLAFRHKTKKLLFQAVYPLALIIHGYVIYRLLSL